MSQYETVLYSVEDRIATISVNRPQVLNAYSQLLRQELLAACEQANNDDNVLVVIFSAEGRAFCAGSDLSEEKPEGWNVISELLTEFKPVVMAMHNSPKIYIAAVQGAAAGGGSAFAMAADFCIMADNAFLYQAFAAIALVPDCGASWFLTQQLGQKKALELMLSGEKLAASRCVELGLANKVVPLESLKDEAQALALSLVKKAPLALKYSKQLVKAAPTMNLSQTIDLEAEYQHVCISSDDYTEGTAAFFEKREPAFTGK